MKEKPTIRNSAKPPNQTKLFTLTTLAFVIGGAIGYFLFQNIELSPPIAALLLGSTFAAITYSFLKSTFTMNTGPTHTHLNILANHLGDTGSDFLDEAGLSLVNNHLASQGLVAKNLCPCPAPDEDLLCPCGDSFYLYDDTDNLIISSTPSETTDSPNVYRYNISIDDYFVPTSGLYEITIGKSSIPNSITLKFEKTLEGTFKQA